MAEVAGGQDWGDRGAVHKKFVSPDIISDAWGLEKMQIITINHTATLFSESRGGPGVEEHYTKCMNVMLQSPPHTAQAIVPAATFWSSSYLLRLL